jgi:hypothetical protein
VVFAKAVGAINQLLFTFQCEISAGVIHQMSAAIADRESPHDANALALNPITRTIQAANLTKFRIWVSFIMTLLVKLRDIWQLLKKAYRVETLSLADISFVISKPGGVVHPIWPPARGLKSSIWRLLDRYR